MKIVIKIIIQKDIDRYEINYLKIDKFDPTMINKIYNKIIKFINEEIYLVIFFFINLITVNDYL